MLRPARRRRSRPPPPARRAAATAAASAQRCGNERPALPRLARPLPAAGSPQRPQQVSRDEGGPVPEPTGTSRGPTSCCASSWPGPLGGRPGQKRCRCPVTPPHGPTAGDARDRGSRGWGACHPPRQRQQERGCGSRARAAGARPECETELSEALPGLVLALPRGSAQLPPLMASGETSQTDILASRWQSGGSPMFRTRKQSHKVISSDWNRAASDSLTILEQ